MRISARQFSLFKKRPDPVPALATRLHPSEQQFQASLVDYLHYAMRPDWAWKANIEGVWLGSAYPILSDLLGHEKARAASREVAARMWTSLERIGAKAGWPDLEFVSPEGLWHGMELKVDKNDLSPAQKAFRDACLAAGRTYVVCRSFGEAEEHLKLWNALKRKGER